MRPDGLVYCVFNKNSLFGVVNGEMKIELMTYIKCFKFMSNLLNYNLLSKLFYIIQRNTAHQGEQCLCSAIVITSF